MLTPTALMWLCFDMPHGPLKDLRSLPALPGVYIVYQGEDVLYIGQTHNLHQRWKAHHRRFHLALFGTDVDIAWHPMPNSDDGTRSLYEHRLIAAFLPRLNVHHYPTPLSPPSNTTRPPRAIRGPIADKRQALGITMTELALRAGMDLAKLSRLERGHLKTRVEDLQRLAQVLGCKTSELIDDAEITPVGVEGE